MLLLDFISNKNTKGDTMTFINKLITPVLITLTFTGCGGGGGGGSTTEATIYDFANYFTHPQVLSDDKIFVKQTIYKSYLNGNLSFTDNSTVIDQKFSTNKIDSYDLSPTPISTLNDYYNAINGQSIWAQTEILENNLKTIYYRDNNEEEVDTRYLKIGDQVMSETTNTNSIYSCILNNHYDTLNDKEKINAFFTDKNYFNDNGTTYHDVIEFKCTDSIDTSVIHYAYMVKNEGFKFSFGKEQTNTTQLKDYFYYITSSLLLSR